MPTPAEAGRSLTRAIRKYREGDLECLKDIVRDVFGPGSIDFHLERHFGLVAGMSWQERKVRHLEWDLAAEGGEIFVSERKGRVIGFITVVLDIEAKIGRMVNLAVARECQDRGVAHQLIERGLEYMTESGMAVAKIETLDGNHKGEHIFPSMGFKEVARQIHYFKKL